MPSLSIVFPCYNPPCGWEQNVMESCNLIHTTINYTIQLVIVNDGSTIDIKSQVGVLQNYFSLKKVSLIYIELPLNKGKGFALRQGIAQANSEYIIYTDIDFPFTIQSFFSILDILKNDNVDLAVGIKNKNYYNHLPIYRQWISKILRIGISIFFKLPISDTQCGLKGFHEKLKPLFLRTTINRYLFDLEFICTAYKIKPKLKIRAVEIDLRPEVFFGKMNTKIIIKESYNFLKIMLNY